MRKICINLLFAHFAVFSCFFCSSQNSLQDSLKRIASKNAIDTGVIDANLLLCQLLEEDKPDESIGYGIISLNKAKQLKDKFRIAKAHQSLGVSYDYKGNLDSCLYHLIESLSGFEAISKKVNQSHVISDIALAYYFRGNYELALRNHLKALELRKQIGEAKYLAVSYLNIGLVYRSKKDYTNAISFYKQSYFIKKTINDELGMLNCLINMGASFQTQGIFDSAYSYGLQALQLATKLNSKLDINASKANVGAALVNLKKSNEALVYLKDVEKNEINVGKGPMITTYESLGDLYSQQGNLVAAKHYYQKAFALAASNKRVEAMEVFYRKLSKVFYKEGNYKEAFNYFSLSKALSDTMHNAENTRQVNEMSAVYQTAEKETQIQKLNAEHELSILEEKRRRRERNYFIISSILFLGMAVVAYKAFTSNKKKKERLDAQNKVIETSLAEKEILLREIHHRVKNNLQVVSSLLSLQSNYIKDEQALDAVKESRNRVQSMSLIHQNLYQEDSITGIDIQNYIEQLAENLFNSYKIQSSNLRLIKEIEPLQLDVDTVIPIGLIMNELITNCLKYAFTTNTNTGVIKVILKEENKALRLSVYDNGIGLPPDFQPGVKKSFGHKMINAFLQKLKGTMKMYSEGGTRVDIEITNFKMA